MALRKQANFLHFSVEQLLLWGTRRKRENPKDAYTALGRDVHSMGILVPMFAGCLEILLSRLSTWYLWLIAVYMHHVQHNTALL